MFKLKQEDSNILQILLSEIKNSFLSQNVHKNFKMRKLEISGFSSEKYFQSVVFFKSLTTDF